MIIADPPALSRFTGRGFPWLIGSIAALVVAVGLAVSWWQEQTARRMIESSVLGEARMVAAALDLRQVAALAGDESDLVKPEFLYLQAQIRRIKAANPRYQYVYLMGRHGEELPFFFMGSAPEDSPEYSPPGQVYEVLTSALDNVFSERTEQFSKPVTDDWGYLVSALIPLSNPDSGELMAVLGLDLDARELNNYALLHAAVPLALALFALALLIVFALGLRMLAARESQRQMQLAYADLELLNARLEEEIAEKTAAEHALSESELRYKMLFESANDAIIIADGARIVDCNERAEAYFNLPRGELLQKTVIELSPPLQQDGMTSAQAAWKYLELAYNGTPQFFEWLHMRSDGSIFLSENSISAFEHDGKQYMQGIMRDITERRKAEQELQLAYAEKSEMNAQLEEEISERLAAERAMRTSEAKFRAVFEQAPYTITLQNSRSEYVDVNHAFSKVIGRPVQEILGATPVGLGLFTPEVHERLYQALLQQGGFDMERVTVIAPDGSLIHSLLKSIAIDIEGELHFLTLAVNITDYVNQESALRESTMKFRKVVENAQAIIFILDLNGVFLMSEGLALANIGFKPSQVVGQSVFDVFKGEKELLDAVRQALTGMPVQVMVKVQGLYFDTLYSPLYSDNGELNSVLGIATDVTELHRAELALRETSELLQRVLDAAPQYICWKDRESRYLGCNMAFCKLHGLASPADLPGKTDWDLNSRKDQIEFYLACDKRIMDSDTPEYKIRETGLSLDGTEIWYETTKIPLHDSDGQVIGILVLIDDITEHHLAELEVEQSKERYRLLAETAQETITIVDLQGKLSYANRATQEITGYSEEELIGSHMGRFTLSEEGVYWEELLRQRLAGHHDSMVVTTELLAKDGRRIPLEFTTTAIVQDGQIKGVMNVGRDISDRLQADKARQQLQQAQKLEAIGTLAGGIAHDFNNILFAITANAELLEMEVADGSPAMVCLEQILQAAHRAKELVKRILTFSRHGQSAPIVLSLSSVVNEVVKLLRPALPAGIEMHVDTRNSAARIMADPTEMHQVLMNLCTNAAHAMPAGEGLLEIKLKDLILDQESVPGYTNAAPGNFVQLTVSDSGSGMPAHVRERIFEPFFTTKEAGAGTGLGLSMVHGIITRLGGYITVYSEPGAGTTFHIYLPVIADMPEYSTPEAVAELPRGSGRILVVDDEVAVTSAISRSLEALGYNVVACNSSIDALELFTGDPQAFDLVITDLTMPKMNGAVLSREVLNQRPDVPIILCTGFSQTVSAETTKEIGICSYLAKPVSRAELAHTVARLLGFSTAL